MTTRDEFKPSVSGLSVVWEDTGSGAQPRISTGTDGGVSVSHPIRLCLPSGEIVESGYERIAEHAGGWTAQASLLASDGTQLDVVDEWSTTAAGAVAVARRATVARAGAGEGVRLELRATADGAASFDEWQLFVPGALYNRNDTDFDGREDYLGTYVQEYRDDRLPSLAVLGFSPTAGRAVAISRAGAPDSDTDVTDRQIVERRAIQETDIGSLGLAPAGSSLELRASYPFAEEHSFCL